MSLARPQATDVAVKAPAKKINILFRPRASLSLPASAIPLTLPREYAETVHVVHAMVALSSRLSVGRAVATTLPSMATTSIAMLVTANISQRRRPAEALAVDATRADS
jgi:hypothetical protein